MNAVLGEVKKNGLDPFPEGPVIDISHDTRIGLIEITPDQNLRHLEGTSSEHYLVTRDKLVHLPEAAVFVWDGIALAIKLIHSALLNHALWNSGKSHALDFVEGTTR
jgi:hypothetical protein